MPRHLHTHTTPSPTAAQPIHDLALKVDVILQRLADLLGLVQGVNKELLTVEEVAEAVGRAPYTVRTWIRDGRLRAIRVEGSGPRGRLLVPRDQLARLLEQGLGGDISSMHTSKKA